MGFERALEESTHQIMCMTWDKARSAPWQSDDKNKNRLTLIRTLVWYLDRWKDDPLQTYQLSSGRAAVELSFSFDSGYLSSTSEPFTLCGHFDRVVSLHDNLWISDIKSTKSTIGSDWFSKFTPDNQFTLYSLAGKIAFNLETQGIIVDGTQIWVNESRFARGIVRRTSYQLEEWHRDLGQHLELLDKYAREAHWPQNDKACNLYGGCPYREVCSAGSASTAEKILHGTFKRRVWDPLIRRGDI